MMQGVQEVTLRLNLYNSNFSELRRPKFRFCNVRKTFGQMIE